MSDEARNIRNFTRFQEEILAKGDFSALPEVMAQKMLVHASAVDNLSTLMGHPVPPGTKEIDRDMLVNGYSAAFAAVESQSRKVVETVASGDTLFARWMLKMKVNGDFHGLPAHGKEVTIDEWGVIKFDDDGKIIEGRFCCDNASILSQLGAKVSIDE